MPPVFLGGRRPSTFRTAVLAAVLVLAAAPPTWVGPPLGSGQGARAADNFANVELPPDVGQTEREVYVEASKHTLKGTFLDYWRASGAASVYGNPVSEPFAGSNGYYSQAFEAGVFQYRPEFLYTDEPIVRLMPVGETLLRVRVGTFRADGRRGGGGGDRRASAWRRVDPNGDSAARAVERGGFYDEATGHTVVGAFRAWYDANEGEYYLGHPLSQAVRERGMTVQWFEGGLLMTSQGGDGGTRLAPVVREQARALGISTKRVPRGDRPVFDETLFWGADNPNPLGGADAPGRKRIDISLSQQTLWAYQGDTAVTSSLVSTGLDPNGTEVGNFHVRLKYPEQDMQGFTNSTGEVLGFGDAPPGSESYQVKDVPNVMYFNMDAEALHGAYWHNNFGQKMSHGCVNLPLEVATFLFGWAPLGTEVKVYK